MKKRLISFVGAAIIAVSAVLFFDVNAEACTTNGGNYLSSHISYSWLNPEFHNYSGYVEYYCNVCHKVCYQNVSGMERHSYSLSCDMYTLECICGDSYGY